MMILGSAGYRHCKATSCFGRSGYGFRFIGIFVLVSSIKILKRVHTLLFGNNHNRVKSMTDSNVLNLENRRDSVNP